MSSSLTENRPSSAGTDPNRVASIFSSFQPGRLAKEWNRNHRHHGGILPLLRCLAGDQRLRRVGLNRHSKPNPTDVETVTFSVVPKMTLLWSVLMQEAMPHSAQTLIGDCSGGFPGDLNLPGVRVFPLLNHPHGIKLDLFIQRICCAPYVVVTDDDVFWMSEKPLRWALAEFEADERVAVVSLMPRDTASSVLEGKVPQPMGSFCLVIRRDLWIKEGLSFRIVQPPASEGYGWFYDTADFANVELLKRGYRVVIAPPELRRELCCLEAISTWTLKIQQRHGDLRRSIGDVELRRAKALRAILTLKGLDRILKTFLPEIGAGEIVKGPYLDRAQAFCLGGMAPGDISSVQTQVEDILQRVSDRLQMIRATKPTLPVSSRTPGC